MTAYRRLILILVAALLVAAPQTRAGTARMLALGGDAGYYRDASNVLRWYGSLGDHPDRIALEFGDPLLGREDVLADQGRVGHGGGVHVRLSEDGAWGTAAFYFQDHMPKAPYEGSFTALWCRGVGPVQVGLNGRFTTYGQSWAGTETGDRIDTRYIHQFGLGLSGEPRDGLRAELAGEVVNSRIETSGALFHLDSDDWTSFGLRARLFMEMAPDLTLVPLLEHTRDQRALYDDILSGPADRDAHMTALGLGVRLRTDPRTVFLISAEYRTGSEDRRLRPNDDLATLWETSDRTFFQIRGRASVETEITRWLTARAALQYVRIRDDVTRASTRGLHDDLPHGLKHRFVGGVAPLSLGVGLHLGDLTADLAYNDSRPVNPGLAAEGLYAGDEGGYSAISLGWRF